MTDVVVTVPSWFDWPEWVGAGDAAGEPATGKVWPYLLGPGYAVPTMDRGERVYVIYREKLRGYAPLLRIERYGARFALVRGGGAVAVTLSRARQLRGFAGWKPRWWDRAEEIPFPDWKTP